MTNKTLRIAVALGSLLVASAASAEGLPKNWPMSPSELERRFMHDDFKIIEVKSAGAGVTGASKFKIRFADGKILKVKWKEVPAKSFDGWNNSPRKEMAAYAIQHWFNDENDYVVPTIAPRCIPLEDYKVVTPHPKPSIPGTSCVLGVIAVWIDEVTVPRKFYDPKLFRNDPAYARSMADFNLLTYLVEHRDGRQGNILQSTVPGDPRVFAIDNGISFDPFPWNFLVANWYKIRVPWLNRASVDRLRKIDDPQLDALGVIAELEADASGRLHVVTPGKNIDDDKGVKRSGTRVQFGLKEDDIDELEDRIEKLLENVDEGRQPVR